MPSRCVPAPRLLAAVRRERVEQHPPDVVLLLIVRAVADSDGPVAVTGEVGEVLR